MFWTSKEKFKRAVFTSHIFLALKHDECIATVGFTLFVTLFMSMRICNDANL